jgi:hypothetical protein
MFAFQLCDFLTGNAKLHTRYGTTACWRNWRFTLNAKHAGHARRFGTGSTDMTLAFFFNALLYEIHCISH